MKRSKKTILLLVVTVFLVIFSSCGPNIISPEKIDPNPEEKKKVPPPDEDLFPTAPEEEPIWEPEDEEPQPLPPEAAIKAREALAEMLNIPLDQVEILMTEKTEWPDGCLGLAGPAESCLAVITPGWRVKLETKGMTYTARTDEPGDQIRFEKLIAVLPVVPPAVPPPEGGDSSLPGAVLKAQEVLSARLDIPIEEIEIVSYKHTEWPDGCLGLPAKGMMCTMAIVPGWRVELSADGQSFVARTNETGSQVKFE